MPFEMNSIKKIWSKLSRLGLYEHEGVFGHREVILLNKILVVAPIVILLLIPFEIYFNGLVTLPLELTLLIVTAIPLILQRYRLFYLARIFILLSGNTYILIAGVLVGKNVNNNLALIPIMLFGLLIFKTTRDKIIVFIIAVVYFVALEILRDIIPPSLYVAPEVKEKFSHIFFLTALLLTFILGFYFVSINNEYEKQIIDQNQKIFLKNKEITDSINYAKRIQQAKLPRVEDIHDSFKQSFILFKPKDIVSGDFYFYHKTENLVFIAAADCTGHGVPGALMSMLASEQLNEAVLRTVDTSEILKYVNQGIKNSLRQTESNTSSKDGMDIALCSVDTKNLIVKYAGANRPLWIVKNGREQVEEIKATKKAIGGFTEDLQHFETHEVKLSKGDTFYIFTDGYADQFSGENSKKLMTKKFKEILISIQNKNMQQQEKYLFDFVENWKKDVEQVDDILVIGVRL